MFNSVGRSSWVDNVEMFGLIEKETALIHEKDGMKEEDEE